MRLNLPLAEDETIGAYTAYSPSADAHAGWSANGDAFAYRVISEYAGDTSHTRWSDSLFIVDMSGPHPETPVWIERPGHADPEARASIVQTQWSPTDARLSFVLTDARDSEGTGALYVVDAASESPHAKAIEIGEGSLPVLTSVWSPDGTQLAVVTAVPDDELLSVQRFFVVDANGEHLRELLFDVAHTGVSWSASSRWLAIEHAGDGVLKLFDTDAAGDDPLLPAWSETARGFAWSASGDRFVFERTPPGSLGDSETYWPLYVLDLNGAHPLLPQALTSVSTSVRNGVLGENISQALWSPADDRVVYGSIREGSHVSTLTVLDPNSDARRLLTDLRSQVVDWAFRDRLVYIDGDELRWIDLDDESAHRLATGTFDFNDPSRQLRISPDGSRIAIQAELFFGPVAIVRIEEDAPAASFEIDVIDSSVWAWLKDSRALVAASYAGQPYTLELLTVDVAGAPVRKVLVESDARPLERLSVQP